MLLGRGGGGIAVAAATVAAVLLVRRRRRVTVQAVRRRPRCGGVTAVGLLVIRSGDIKQFKSTIDQKHEDAGRQHVLAANADALHRPADLGGASDLRRGLAVGARAAGLLAVSRRRAPALPEPAGQAFPSPIHRWGVDNAYVQSLAELGIVGTAVFLGFLATGLVDRDPRLAARAAGRRSLALIGAPLAARDDGDLGRRRASSPEPGFAALPFFGLGLIAAQRAAERGRPHDAGARHRRRRFIGSNLVRALRERGDEVRVLDNFSTGLAREPRRARRRDRRGRASQLRARPQRRARRRGRLPPRCARLGAALGAGSAHLERGQHRGHAERAARRARRGRSPRRLLLVDLGVRDERRAPDPRGLAARPDLALRRGQARGRALLQRLLTRLRRIRDRRAAVLQRLRPATEPVVAVRGRRAALHHGDRRGPRR